MLEASLGLAQHHKNLPIFPILAEAERDLPYLLMADALNLGILTVGEKNGGEVPILLATNAGLHSILILDGEQLIGAKQNRMTNRSILLPPNSITEIPVSCMEQGRWHFDSDHFAPAPQHAPSKVRRKARETERIPSDSVGAGEYSILRGRLLGGELADEGKLAHLSAFPAIQHERGAASGRWQGLRERSR